jgi:hypothetical protein
MNSELHSVFLSKVKEIIKTKSLPTEDICRIFNILVTITAFASKDEVAVLNDVLARLRANILAIPKEIFP